jgi:hypothetical protein
MPFPIFGWIIIGAIAGIASIAAVAFLDEITEWASRMLDYILDGINKAIEVTSDAIVSVVKEGSKFYRDVMIYVSNTGTGQTRIERSTQEINPSEIPSEIIEALQEKTRIQIGQQKT